MAVTDDFNRADGALGANWTNSGPGTVPHIVSNTVKGNDAFYGAAHYTGASFSDAHSSQIRYANAVSYVGPTVRASAGGNWYAYLNNGSVDKCVGGSVSTIATRDIFFENDIVKLSVSGTTITPYINGTPGATITDGSLSGGAPGVGFYGTDAGSIDDWEGTGEIVSAGLTLVGRSVLDYGAD